ncbi:MAG: DEAD/DEAH box helicase family protein, partial [Paludibacter sp.]
PCPRRTSPPVKPSLRSAPLATASIRAAPIWSVRTFMVSSVVNALNFQPDWDYDKAYVWITFSDDLAMQSKEKFYEYFFPNISNRLLTVNDFGEGKLQKNDVLFLNWQKLVAKSAESRRLRRPDDDRMQKETGFYFEDIVENTLAEGREIVMIIDESHKNVTLAAMRDVIDPLQPKVIIEVSATPDYEPTISDVRKNLADFIEVEREEVIGEGLIKEKIVCQTEENLQKHKAQDFDHVLLDLAIEKKQELEAEYSRLGKNINPLILIQLPNDDTKSIDQGNKTKEEVVLQYLHNQHIAENKIALWFDGKQKNMEFISDKDNSVDFMLFKQAAGTGWDCPRAHILVMYREISSATFYTQTIGRILRMAEPNCKADYVSAAMLRTGYLFTNYRRDEVKVPDESEANKPYVFTSECKFGEFEVDANLKSDFISRVDYGDFSDAAKFQRSFIESFDSFFNINDDDILIEQKRLRLDQKSLLLETHITDSIIVNAEFDDFEHINTDIKKRGTDSNYEVSQNDIEKIFTALCSQLLKEQTEADARVGNIARSWSPFKTALRLWLLKTIDSNSDTCYRVFINDIRKNANSVFRPAITQALKEYRPILKEILALRKQQIEEREAMTFNIRKYYSYTTEYELYPSELSIWTDFYLQKEYKGRENESAFIQFLEGLNGKIDWWFKNGSEGKDYYSLRYYNTAFKEEKLFYPDWIIRFADGRIGIFDTKGGQTAINPEGRAEALAQKIKLLNTLGETKFVGGLIVSENGQWYYNGYEEYEYTPGKMNKYWKLMTELF